MRIVTRKQLHEEMYPETWNTATNGTHKCKPRSEGRGLQQQDIRGTII
jgi:hypothetical protein